MGVHHVTLNTKRVLKRQVGPYPYPQRAILVCKCTVPCKAHLRASGHQCGQLYDHPCKAATGRTRASARWLNFQGSANQGAPVTSATRLFSFRRCVTRLPCRPVATSSFASLRALHPPQHLSVYYKDILLDISKYPSLYRCLDSGHSIVEFTDPT